MKRFILIALMLACAVTLGANALQQKPDDKATVDVSGKWTMTLDMSMGRANPALTLGQSGTTLTGNYTGRYGSFPIKGTIKGRSIQFTFEMGTEGQTITMSFSGEVAADGQSMKGTASMGDMGDATWTATRDK